MANLSRYRLFLCMTVCASAVATAIAYLIAEESPLLNRILTAPPAYTKASAILALRGGLWDAGFEDMPLQPRAANDLHLLHATKDRGCHVQLKTHNKCALEAIARTTPPHVNIHFWLFQPPGEVMDPGWSACQTGQDIRIPGSDARFMMKPLLVEKRNRLGVWYHQGNHTRELWASYGAMRTDFARLYVLEVHGGIYLDLDVVVGDPRVFFLQDGAGLQ